MDPRQHLAFDPLTLGLGYRKMCRKYFLDDKKRFVHCADSVHFAHATKRHLGRREMFGKVWL